MKNTINSFKIIFLFFIATAVNAQVATYKLNGNLSDDLSTNKLAYEKLGLATSENPVFGTSTAGQQIDINSKYGLSFPKSLIDQIDANSSFEIEFTMKIKTLGSDRSRIHILSQQDNWINYAGFAIFADQPNSTSNNFNLTFVHSDGGSINNVPDHNIFTTNSLGNYNVGDEIKINLIIDLENRNWAASVNKNKYNGKFNETYVWQDIVSAIKNNKWYLNWIKDYQTAVNINPSFYNSQINYDEINFYIPRKPVNEVAIRTALQEMTAHVGKTKRLTNEQKENYTGEIIVGLSEVYSNLKTDILKYTHTYEQNQPILFSNREQVVTSGLPAEARLILFIQQYIHDFQFTTENIDNVVGIKFKFADVFPGKVKASAPRISNGQVAINGKHISLKNVRYAFDYDSAKRPTGYYAAPGEIVTITIPNHLIDKGLEVQIGAHTGDLSTKQSQNRFNRVTKTFPLNKTSTRIASPFGGGIYIKIAQPSDLGWFDVAISGAVKSPYFRYIPGRETLIADWQKDILDRNVEWADIESEKYMMTLPWINLKGISDPSNLLTQWNKIMDAYNYVGGFPAEAKIKADYFIVDSMIPTPAFGIGYPQAFGNSQVPYTLEQNNGGYPTYVLNPSFIKPYNFSTAVLFHEIGHSNSFPRVDSDTESVVHLYASYIYNKLYGFSIDEAFKYSFFQQMELNDAAIDWMVTHNFRNNIKMSCDPLLAHLPDGECDEIRYQHRGHAKYSEIAKRFGWEFVHKMNKVFYDKNIALNLNADETKSITTDQLVEAASDANAINMAPLFHFWGYKPSTELAEKLKAKYVPDGRLFDMLNHYKTVVPKTAAELNTYFNEFKTVVNNSVYTTHISKYDNENYFQQITNQIDYIINYYNLSYTTIWNGTSWSNGIPAINSHAIIAANYCEPFNLTACSLRISGNAIAVIPTGYNLTISGKITVEPTARLTIKNNSNLIQIENKQNEGVISIETDSAAIKLLDFTIWSSPVGGQKLQSFFPLTLPISFYKYNSFTDKLYTVSPLTKFEPATGYFIRIPNDHPNVNTIWNGVFRGVPNNGLIFSESVNLNVSEKQVYPVKFSYLQAVGNPYPSTISANAFMDGNNITGPLYFWRKSENSKRNVYATYSKAGGVASPDESNATIPNGVIQVGQGFIAPTKKLNLLFTNAMRIFKTSIVEKDRFWINLSSNKKPINQLLIAFVKGATDGIDAQLDAQYIEDLPVSLTTKIGNEKFVIQAKGLPFENTEIIPLSLSILDSGEYTITLSQVEGLFSKNQDIFIKDNLVGLTHNIKSSNYKFNSNSGVFNNRFEVVFKNDVRLVTNIAGFNSANINVGKEFEVLKLNSSDYNFNANVGVETDRFSLKFQKTLDVNKASFDENKVKVFKNNETIYVSSDAVAIDNIKVYDVLGRQIAEQKNINQKTATLKNINANSKVLILKITGIDKKEVIKKVLN